MTPGLGYHYFWAGISLGNHYSWARISLGYHYSWAGISLAYHYSWARKDHLIWKSVLDFIVICFDFDGIILHHVTSNLAQFTCLTHNDVIFWHFLNKAAIR